MVSYWLEFFIISHLGADLNCIDVFLLHYHSHKCDLPVLQVFQMLIFFPYSSPFCTTLQTNMMFIMIFCIRNTECFIVFLTGTSQREHISYTFWFVHSNIQIIILQKQPTCRFQSILQLFASQDASVWKGTGVLN